MAKEISEEKILGSKFTLSLQTMSADDTSISAAFGSLSGATGALKVMSLGFS
jgi:hypothetical protein|tara:strand:- start:1045 stop:1200 length:156 start_codon:yes stop_codon:yes gene_type:complete